MTDWTSNGRGSNNSPRFLELCKAVEALIRGDAHMLIQGRADRTAGLIMAQLAHVHNVGPLRAAGGPSDADVMKWVTDNPYFGDWDEWAPIAYDKIPVLPRMALSHLYGKHADRENPFAHCVFCEVFDLRAAGGQEKPNDERARVLAILADKCNHRGIRSSDFTEDGHCVDCMTLLDALAPAAPVGGQHVSAGSAEEIRWYASGFCPASGDPLIRSGDRLACAECDCFGIEVVRPTAAVSGEQA